MIRPISPCSRARRRVRERISEGLMPAVSSMNSLRSLSRLTAEVRRGQSSSSSWPERTLVWSIRPKDESIRMISDSPGISRENTSTALARRSSASLPRKKIMTFKRFVEIGRVALVNYGKDYGQLVVIVDVVDQNRALVDSPDMIRSQINFKRLSLTDIKIDIPRTPKKKTLIAAMEEADVKNKWEKSSWGRKLIVQQRRASLNDFDRFKVMLAKIKRGGVLKQELAKLKKESAA